MADAAVELPLLAKRLKAAGMVGVRSEMVAGLRRAARPLIPDIQASARANLPRRGGMNTFMAAKRPSVSVRTGASSAGVSIRYRGKGSYSDTGEWRHPVFGHRDRWATTSYEGAVDWYPKGAEAGTPAARREMESILVTVGRQVNGGLVV